ncbi:hypothetical protein HLB23_22415 [Nocardia uniformis]|uniref:Uncharacterized protein n=1 Tax=Nocardia uniformis TaxID=53432 RepID=A0A849C885_9NOCA|nr:hypothetical protein [Nocardia uniformis]NNH72580.1 hypothetical protein [Nocardia uniformis]
MSWTDLHTRMDILHTVVDRAARNAADPRLFDGIPELNRLFGGPAGVLLALRYRWDNHLRVKMEHALAQGKSAVEVYLELAAEQPGVRAILDTYDTDRLMGQPRASAYAH